jgi:predicted house-cleaning NTP pyrophosphatase (Maf/HAM1 superfamily)
MLLASNFSARRHLLEQAEIPRRVQVSDVQEGAITAPNPA